MLKTFIKQSRLFRLWVEFNIWKSERNRFFADVPNNIRGGQLRDYKKAFYRHRVTFSEYYHQYKFNRLPEPERAKFVSVSSMQCAYRRLVTPKVRSMFHEKPRFLELWREFINREWVVVTPEIGYEEFVDFMSTHDVIVKLPSGTRGEGIQKISKNDSVDYRQLYEDCLKHSSLVEECIVGDKFLQAFHPSSLNTIRVVTFKINEKVIITGAFFRTGRGGNVIDNAHAGGIFGQINVDTGLIESNGIDVYGNEFKEHPDTYKQFKGYRVPLWDACKEICCKAMEKYPEVLVAGWDICINDKGMVEIIEGNHAPDIDLMQSPLKIGKKDFYQSLLNNYAIKLK